MIYQNKKKILYEKVFTHKKVYEQDEILTNIANVETAAQISPVVDEVPTEGRKRSYIFSKLFESREMAHVYHLQVRGDEGSHAAHTLGEYYEGILDLIDTVIETYQGQYGIVDGYETIDTNGTKTKKHTLKNLQNM
jgi:hypothetical protein